MQNRNVTAQVIDFNSYRSSSSSVTNVKAQPAYMPIFFYYPVYYVSQPLQSIAVKSQPEEPKQYENNVVSIYDYLGEI